MMVGNLVPVYTADNSFAFDWDDSVDVSLLLAFGIFVMMQLMLMIYIVLGHFQPGAIYRQKVNESYRRRYGNFIFRRLLAELDRALMLRPCAGQELSSCLEAKRIAESAIRLFCRDTAKVLYPEYELDSLAATDIYFVLEDEESELNSAGYSSVDVDVTYAFLEGLLYPKRANVPGKNKLKS